MESPAERLDAGVVQSLVTVEPSLPSVQLLRRSRPEIVEDGHDEAQVGGRGRATARLDPEGRTPWVAVLVTGGVVAGLGLIAAGLVWHRTRRT